MSLTDQEIAVNAREAILTAIDDLAHDRMGHGEQLSDLDAYDGLSEEEETLLTDRFEEEIRRQRLLVAGWLDEVIADPRCETTLDDRSRCIEAATEPGPGGLVMHEHRFPN